MTKEAPLAFLFEHPPQEGEWELESIEGEEIPDAVRGTYLLNGPADFNRGQERFRHWLDGDGMVVAVEIGGPESRPRCVQRQRFVGTARRLEELRAGRILYRAFGTSTEGDRLLHGVVLASPGNVSVFPFADRLLACGEQGRPWELDPSTLETRGEWTGGGRLTAVSPFSAHPKVDPRTGQLVGFGVSYAASQPCIVLYTFAADGSPLERHRIPLAASFCLHDMAISEHYAVFWLGPHHLDVERFRSGSTVAEALAWKPELGSEILVVERRSGAEVVRIAAGNGACLHLVNAFETGERGLVLDVLELDRPVYDDYGPLPRLYERGGVGRPVRWHLDLDSGSVLSRRKVEGAPAPEFPCIDADRLGRSSDRCWCLGLVGAGRGGAKLFEELLAIDWGSERVSGRWRTPRGTIFAGEPVFVPVGTPAGQESRDGHLLVPTIELETLASALLVFDAGRIEEGPQTTIRLAERIHAGFHASWRAC